ncbi:hypothetical protein [Arthrobacter sulfonylureivorans]|jgi:hypothetical protein|uniref:Lipoprotein n=1 Tax=Arthrobacter sulfonylureivorans TaxID=2486855 RepID=A0ABY3W5C2_9MICC|nr:hypothetical protein [Arthrobacter sulfonylureivorans]UNK45465.1 hypothetical protein MNQ99_16335 [Arthrobacter sulfonylureivorans]
MRTLTRLIAGAAVLLAMAGCTSGPKPAPSEPEGSAGSTGAVSTEAAASDVESLAAQSTNKHLLAEKDGYKFYSLVPVNPEDGRLCVVIQSEGGAEGRGCSDSTPYVGTGVEITNLVEAKLVFAGYNAGKDLAEGWRYLHNNLLVRGLNDPKSSS